MQQFPVKLFYNNYFSAHAVINNFKMALLATFCFTQHGFSKTI